MINAIYLRRRSKVLLPEGAGATPITLLAALQKNLEALGFLLDEGVVGRLKSLSPAQVDAFYQRLVKDLRAMLGAHREVKPFYPNFPAQVMALPEAELYFHAIRHYRTGERPAFEAAERPAADEKPQYRILRSGTRDDFDGIFTLLAKSRSPYSPQDKEDVTWFVTQYRDGVRRLLPDQIPCKENLAHLGAELVRHVPDADTLLAPHVRTATDVLRLAVAMSGGDVSLKTAGPFGKFRRRERALLLSWVERAANRTEDMLRWKPRWVRLGERLHPGEYAGRFPQAAAAFDVLRNNRPFETFNGRIEAGLAAKDTAAVMDLLDARPGELARRLDHLARLGPDPDLLGPLCEALLGRWPAETGEGWAFPRLRLEDDVRERFGLVAVADETWRPDVDWDRGRDQERRGWRELTDRQTDEAWNRYAAAFGYPPGRDFKTPSPAATWDISAIYRRPAAEFPALEADLTAKAFRALRAATRPGERLHALDWQHPCYLFDPHHPGATADHESWPVPVLPNGDHYIFLAPDLRFGVIGNCVEQTICVFGRPLLDLLAGDPPRVFDRPTWAAEERRSLRAGWERLGWRLLTCDERDEYRDGFVERFAFDPTRPPAAGPCFREPVPSVAWDIGGLLAAGPAGDGLRAGFTLAVLTAFRRAIPPGGPLIGLDATRWFEHYSFDPHRLSGAGRGEWALPVVPDGAFSVFVTPDFGSGLVGNPAEQSVCVFGRPLLDAVLAGPPPGLGAVLRCDGEAVAPTHVVRHAGQPG